MKPRVKEKLLQLNMKEEQAAVKGEGQKPKIIDLDKYEDDAQEPSDNSMALVVVAAPLDVIHENGHNTELAIVRVDNAENGEITSQFRVRGEQSRNGFNRSKAEKIVECPSPGNGQKAPTPGLWDGPPRWTSSHIGILTVQCARCLKWRVVPTKEQYETIREDILDTPWVCENASPWRPDAHCDLPSDLNQDSQTLWAIDKPNLPSSPSGWQRKVIVRRDCSTRFADVYYTAPDGKSLRSMVEVAKYLGENPASVPEGTQLNQFSFTIPKPLPGVWAPRKRNTMRSVVSLSSSQGEGKKARAAQPLAKQLARRLLHGTNPPFLPIAPPFPLSSGPSFQVPIPPPFPVPSGPQSVCSLGTPAPSVVPAQNFTTSPNPIFPLPLCPMPNLYPRQSSFVGCQTDDLLQVTCYSSRRAMLTSPAVWPPEQSTTMSVPRSKNQQQKSRLGVATSLSQNLNLPGILPLREPNGV